MKNAMKAQQAAASHEGCDARLCKMAIFMACTRLGGVAMEDDVVGNQLVWLVVNPTIDTGDDTSQKNRVLQKGKTQKLPKISTPCRWMG